MGYNFEPDTITIAITTTTIYRQPKPQTPPLLILLVLLSSSSSSSSSSMITYLTSRLSSFCPITTCNRHNTDSIITNVAQQLPFQNFLARLGLQIQPLYLIMAPPWRRPFLLLLLIVVMMMCCPPAFGEETNAL